ncbi:MAG: hypothetical protein ACRDHW_02685, partial [Ktedonobacteraceae bacterium]
SRNSVPPARLTEAVVAIAAVVVIVVAVAIAAVVVIVVAVAIAAVVVIVAAAAMATVVVAGAAAVTVVAGAAVIGVTATITGIAGKTSEEGRLEPSLFFIVSVPGQLKPELSSRTCQQRRKLP